MQDSNIFQEAEIMQDFNTFDSGSDSSDPIIS